MNHNRRAWWFNLGGTLAFHLALISCLWSPIQPKYLLIGGIGGLMVFAAYELYQKSDWLFFLISGWIWFFAIERMAFYYWRDEIDAVFWSRFRFYCIQLGVFLFLRMIRH